RLCGTARTTTWWAPILASSPTKTEASQDRRPIERTETYRGHRRCLQHTTGPTPRWRDLEEPRPRSGAGCPGFRGNRVGLRRRHHLRGAVHDVDLRPPPRPDP